MTAILIANSTTFGALTNNSVARLVGLNTSLMRLREAVATASDGYTGVPGTEFEVAMGGMGGQQGGNNFGVQADPDNPGVRGVEYEAALTALTAQWETFWVAARPYIEQLDNGTAVM